MESGPAAIVDCCPRCQILQWSTQCPLSIQRGFLVSLAYRDDHQIRVPSLGKTSKLSETMVACHETGVATSDCIIASFIFIFGTLLLPVYSGPSGLDLDKQALLSFKEKADLEHMLDGNWTSESNPCTDHWQGVQCYHPTMNRVTHLTLESMNLSGFVSMNSLGQASELRTLSLKGNSLAGTIPSDLSNCANLKKLFLSWNLFSGPIPGSLSSLHRLDRLDLSHNRLAGDIPASITGLQRLLTLRLEENSLTGKVPDLANLLQLRDFNVSWNNLSGRIPDGMASRFPASSLVGNRGLCGKAVSVECPSASRSVMLSKKTIVSTAIGVPVLVAAIASGFLLWFKLRSGKNDEPTLSSKEKHASTSDAEVAGDLVFVDRRHAAEFGLVDLLRAPAELPGKGALGSTFKAVLENGTVVAVKRLVDKTSCEKKVFERRMQVVGRVRHPNLLPLRAYYFYSMREKLLVYDYMPTGSLYSILHGSGATPRRRIPLGWSMRLRIARGVAQCLAFLHQQCKLAHGNIKSSNVLLDDEYEPQISEFGLLSFMSPQQVREDGYRAPECTDISKTTRKADVYSFGVVLLELLTGRLLAPQESMADVHNWVLSVMKREWAGEVFDQDMSSLRVDYEEQMLLVLKIAMLCVSHAPERRPKMSHVVKMMEEVPAATPNFGSPTSTSSLL